MFLKGHVSKHVLHSSDGCFENRVKPQNGSLFFVKQITNPLPRIPGFRATRFSLSESGLVKGWKNVFPVVLITRVLNVLPVLRRVDFGRPSYLLCLLLIPVLES